MSRAWWEDWTRAVDAQYRPPIRLSSCVRSVCVLECHATGTMSVIIINPRYAQWRSLFSTLAHWTLYLTFDSPLHVAKRWGHNVLPTLWRHSTINSVNKIIMIYIHALLSSGRFGNFRLTCTRSFGGSRGPLGHVNRKVGPSRGPSAAVTLAFGHPRRPSCTLGYSRRLSAHVTQRSGPDSPRVHLLTEIQIKLQIYLPFLQH